MPIPVLLHDKREILIVIVKVVTKEVEHGLPVQLHQLFIGYTQLPCHTEQIFIGVGLRSQRRKRLGVDFISVNSVETLRQEIRSTVNVHE